MPVIHLPDAIEVEILPSPVMLRVKCTSRFLTRLEDGEPVGHPEYATVTIDEATGSVSCQSGFGDFAYFWPPHARSEDIFTFLASLNFDYFMGKAAKQPWQLLDLDKTIENLRNEIRQERRGRRAFTDLSKDQANDLWDALDSIEAERPATTDAFFHHWWQHSELGEWFNDYIPCTYMRVSPTAQAFWDHLWRPLVTSAQFRAHMKRRKVAA